MPGTRALVRRDEENFLISLCSETQYEFWMGKGEMEPAVAQPHGHGTIANILPDHGESTIVSLESRLGVLWPKA